MNCPYCKSKNTKVVDKRDNEDTNTTRRRRECEECKKRFTTYERIEKVLQYVVKRDGSLEEYDRNKIKLGIMKAVKKRTISEEDIEKLIDTIENKIMNSDASATTVQAIDIGKYVLQELTKIDKLGAILFASVYKEFQSLEDLQKELEKYSKS
jgi:transcriptional repressor NrdR